jgi:putative DNA primase/helicase
MVARTGLDPDLLRRERQSRHGGNGKDSAREWPQPQPLPDGLPSVPAFEAELLPEAFRPWVMDVAERMQCPPDYPAVGVMVEAGSLIGRQLAIRPKRHDDWTVVPNLWGMIVGRPSLLKSPALHEALHPLRAMEAQAAKDHQDVVADWEADQVIAKEAVKVNATEIRKLLKKDDRQGAHALARQDLQSDAEPTRRRYLVNDATIEKLALILASNPTGVLVFRDELIGFLRSLDREGHEQDRAFYLESWSGLGRFTVDRVGRGTLDIEACCVSILGGIQPGPLSEYLAAAVRLGVADDGLLQRFQLAVWPDPPATWRNVDRWPQQHAKHVATEACRGLAQLDPTALDAEREDDGIPFLRLDAKAQFVFDEWRADLERATAQRARASGTRGPSRKVPQPDPVAGAHRPSRLWRRRAGSRSGDRSRYSLGEVSRGPRPPAVPKRDPPADGSGPPAGVEADQGRADDAVRAARRLPAAVVGPG